MACLHGSKSTVGVRFVQNRAPNENIIEKKEFYNGIKRH